MKNLPAIRLVQIDPEGQFPGMENSPALIRESLPQTREYFRKVGYHLPWIGYAAFDGDQCVGVCAFKTAPENNRVEISYGTAEEHRGKGYAKAMALELTRIAKATAPEVIVAAQTLPEPSPSTSVLASLGFKQVAELQHPEDGLVWEWQLR